MTKREAGRGDVSMQESSKPMPVEIGRANLQDVSIQWDDGHESIYPAHFLRLACPCAVCVEETTGKKILNPQLVPETVGPMALQLVGRYALQIQWSDTHSSGIYTFEFLRDLCPCKLCAKRESD